MILLLVILSFKSVSLWHYLINYLHAQYMFQCDIYVFCSIIILIIIIIIVIIIFNNDVHKMSYNIKIILIVIVKIIII